MTPSPLFFTNGAVFGHPNGTSVATGQRSITAIVAADQRSDFDASGLKCIDLEGRMLVPGFQDAHVHPVMGGLMRLRCNLEPATNVDEAIDIVRTYAREHPELPWIRGGGWRYRWFPGGNPPSSLLDEVTDRPVYLEVADGHSGWANGTALALAGIDVDTVDPPDGIIVRHPDGSPVGTVHEGAMRLVERILPSDRPDEIDAALTESQQYLLSLGITAWQDAWVTPEIDDAYRRMAEAGRLIGRVRGALWWDRDRGLEQFDELKGRASSEMPGYVPRTVKLMLDGVCENFTASMLYPYLDAKGEVTENRGIDFIDPIQLREVVAAVDAAGLQCHFHALGDRAVRSALDAIEHAQDVNGDRDNRPHLAHIQLIDPSDVPRFAPLGASANMQPLWACAEGAMTDLTIPFLPPDRVAFQYPFGSLERAGARLAMGSDWSVSTPDIMEQIEVAVTRSRPSRGAHEPFLPAERLSLDSAMRAATSGSAYVNFHDDSGKIATGSRADLVVLSENPFQADSIAGIDVDLTVVAGSVAYER